MWFDLSETVLAQKANITAAISRTVKYANQVFMGEYVLLMPVAKPARRDATAAKLTIFLYFMICRKRNYWKGFHKRRCQELPKG